MPLLLNNNSSEEPKMNQKFFEKFTEINPKKTILIVDDLEQMVEQYQNAAQGFDLEIHVAYGVQEGIQKALQIKPDYAILDKDMPDGSGNQVAEAIKKANPEARIAGFTGGDPKGFDPKYFDIRESKASEKQAREIIRILMGSEDPKKAYQDAGSRTYVPSLDQAADLLEIGSDTIIPLDILIQGYDFAQKLQAIEQGVEYQGGLKSPTLEEVRELKEKAGLKTPAQPELMFQSIDEIFQQGIMKTYEEITKQIDKILPRVNGKLAQKLQAFKDSPEIKEFMQDLEKQDFKAIEEKQQYVDFHEIYVEMFEAIK